MKKVKYYKFWGFEKEQQWTNFEKGGWMCLVVITFPIWIWFFFIYKIISEIGRLDGKPKEIIKEVKGEEEETYY
jgi:hypothetical protein